MIPRNSNCPCNSGKKYKRCCGHDEKGQASYFVSNENLMNLLGSGDWLLTIEMCDNSISANKKNAYPHYFKALALKQINKPKTAIVHLQLALKFGLTDPGAYFQYASLLVDQHSYRDALKPLQKAIKGKSDFFDATRLLFLCHFNLSQHRDAIKAFESLGDQFQTDAHLLQCAGLSYYSILNYTKSNNCFQKLLEIDNNNDVVYSYLAAIAEENNDLDLSKIYIDKCLTINKENILAKIVKIKYLRRTGRLDDALYELTEIKKLELSSEDEAIVYNETAKIYEKNTDYRQAIASFTRANENIRKSSKANTSNLLEYLSVLSELDNTCWNDLNSSIALKSAPPTPVFITGFFRSGTSLIERIIGSHSQFQALGETGIFPEIIRDRELEFKSRNFIEKLAKGSRKFRSSMLNKIALAYTNTVNDRYSVSQKFIIDKTPFNFIFIPLIRSVFPHSKIIHINRHPLDVILSNYMQMYKDTNQWSHSLTEITDLYFLSEKLINKHISFDNTGMVIKVNYENLINNADHEIKKLSIFLGVDYEEESLKYYENSNISRTASYAQTNQPIYSTSKYKFKNYLPYLDRAFLEYYNRKTNNTEQLV